MQETYDFYTLIIVVTFLGALLALAFFINKKKDFFRSQITQLSSNPPFMAAVVEAIDTLFGAISAGTTAATSAAQREVGRGPTQIGVSSEN